MRIVSLIPARGGSKSIPGKPLQPINGIPMIDYVIQASVSSLIHNDTYVSTDDDRIKSHVLEKWSGVHVIDRPAELASDIASIEGVMAHFTSLVDYDAIMLIQCTSPMMTYVHINKCINAFIKNGSEYDSYISAYSMEEQDMLFWYKDDIATIPINYNPMDRGRRQDRIDAHYIETGAFYLTTREQFMKTGCRLGYKPYFVEVPFWQSFEVDNWIDLQMIERLMKC